MEVASLKQQVALVGMEKTDHNKLVADVPEDLERCMRCLNVAIVNCNRAETLTRALVTKFVSVVDAAVQQLGNN